jgi:hypothetical protein
LRLEEELKEAKVEEAVFDDNGTGTTSNWEDDISGVEEGDINVNNLNNNAKLAKLAKSAKLAKLVGRAKSTDLWYLSPHVPLEAKDKQKQRKAKPDDKYLARLEAECWAEELKARIRATKLMSQGITYSQMAEGPPHRVPAQVAPRAVRTALTPDAAIAILKDTVERLRLLLPQ